MKDTRLLTRREFLRALVPGWLTRRVVVAALIAACGVVVAIELAEVVRTQGFAATARLAALLVGVGLFIFLLSTLTHAVQRAVAASSDDFRWFISNLRAVVTVVIAMSAGALLHAQWMAGKDVAPILLAVALGFLVNLLRDGKKS